MMFTTSSLMETPEMELFLCSRKETTSFWFSIMKSACCFEIPTRVMMSLYASAVVVPLGCAVIFIVSASNASGSSEA